ncbi:tRNA (adenosine(37)-N6)-threonylcarbamoyltransferase complex dimerization subunit type 1 TsaB [Aquirufa antheringensis]|uniref:tRNA (adenosine(37)-N6)-threonylcarbamoyltransferase complex dimerization subunit type 1 TsaB n=1 Tax=Aquirufa antheringensis TaxID=2516559 RepID=UPI0010328747|nr:tRNA (adenosine(37)-N6)-threonylcarbamoyltransferase complex dimerization subunit type 1 TsaB [Aquirufa antheringensis]MCE4217818.1 tRNA (adenosine(37)-N6)-threonylcarbamoyltransferase complex dimerization subunit type 1 TsaB [Pseudarcicella sp. GAP-15]TBH71290.1 tRNA (adenosine(37)-N6)-threonylcarbamoyltransferase complex dimerization subunit type 1 TsaB [Aquirufa antheringensis]
MSFILSLDTSTQNCSVALHENGQLITQELVDEEGSHSKSLTLLIEKVMKTAGRTLAELSAVAVSNGPGSYTGLRIGLATAKGICFALDKPLICLPTLRVLASAVDAPAGSLLLPMLDARRMEVYAAVYTAALEEVSPQEAHILNQESFQTFAPVVAFGNGSAKWQESCTHSSITFLDGPLLPEAQYMGNLAHEAFLNQKFENLVTKEPDYLKEYMGTKPKLKSL